MLPQSIPSQVYFSFAGVSLDGISGAPEQNMSASYSGVKVFSATKARERESLGERITEWIADNKQIEIVDTTVTQSSDREFHCLSITIFYRSK